MKPASRPRSQYMQPDVPEERANRLWEGIVREGHARRVRRRVEAWTLAGAVVAAAIAVLLVKPWAGRAAPVAVTSPPNFTGMVVDGKERSQELVLPDGSTIVIEPATRLVIVGATETSVRLKLERGRVTCDVTPKPERPFIVEAGDNEVSVKGTRFSVSAQGDDGGGPALEVHVDHGVVEVGNGHGAPVAVLHAGETWMKDPVEETHDAGALAPPRVATPPHTNATPLETASALYARAEAAHSAGRNDEAATLYDQVRRRYPNDGHAGLAAFEAGRLRLYSLSDPRGAVDSLGFAMRHMTGTYREDAEALRVEALARGGDVAACRSARDAFTKRYPSSPRAASIAAECP